jgi:hypothetical protein
MQPGYCHLVHLKEQSPDMRKVFAMGEKAALKKALFGTFFMINDPGYTALTTLLTKVASDLNLPHIVVTFRQDEQFAQDIARVVSSQYLRFIIS